MNHKIAIGRRFHPLSRLSNCVSIQDIGSYENIINCNIGLCHDERKLISSIADDSANAEIGHQFIKPKYMKDGRHPTHKEKLENILVKNVFQQSQTQYSAELMLDGDNEFLLDHVNGVHIPGLVFVEATRQVAMTIFHTFLQDSEEDVYFVLNDIHSQYLGFAFPIKTTAEAEMTVTSPSGNQFNITLAYHQNNKVIVRSEANFTVHPKARFSRFEMRAAENAMKQQLNQLLEEQKENACEIV